tara:strand:- start:210 stop:710 length:501 start_codon:yes stop_codon:yes gene_type:complete
MVKLTKNDVIAFFRNNEKSFENYPVVANFLKDVSSWNLFNDLCNEVTQSQGLHAQIAALLGTTSFEIENEVLEIKNGFELARLVKNNSIEISEGEATWIDLLYKLDESNKSACCSTRAQILNQSNDCYNDLINQCSSEWIFVNNIKKFCNVSKIIFYQPHNTKKEV